MTSAAILLPILVGIILWERLPDPMPTHWNAAGEVDGWSNKPMAVFGLPLFMLAIQWLVVIATSADPKKQNHPKKILHLIFWMIPVLNLVVMAVIFCTAMGKSLRIEMLIPVLVGVLFIAIGNYLPKCEQNYTIGIKLPWTLNSEENWNKTHHMAGFLWVICGFFMILAGFFNLFWAILCICPVMIFVPLIYSYILYRKGI